MTNASAAPTSSASPVSSTRSASPALFDWLFAIGVLGVAGTGVRIVFFTPFEAAQGAAQKIYYIHVPAALSAYLALTVCALASIVYLWLHDERADRLAESGGEVALLFTTVVLTTGPIWGKPIWGAWWTWDARLTLTLFLWFVTAAYLVLRGALDDPVMRARYSAVLAALAVLLIPFIHLSVYLFRTLHPMPIVLKPDRPSLPAEMLTTFLISVSAFLFFCAVLIRARYRLAVLREVSGVAGRGAIHG
jgi:heme exporter protein C